ncbi:hypothetical protein V6N13_074161 [Hibiscus sabdariffa]
MRKVLFGGDVQNDKIDDGHSTIMWHLLELRRRNWIVRLNHIPREYNMIDDSLAKLASHDNFEIISYSTPPHSLRSLLLADAIT